MTDTEILDYLDKFQHQGSHANYDVQIGPVWFSVVSRSHIPIRAMLIEAITRHQGRLVKDVIKKLES